MLFKTGVAGGVGFGGGSVYFGNCYCQLISILCSDDFSSHLRFACEGENNNILVVHYHALDSNLTQS